MARRTWKLTQRLAVTIAVVASLLLALHAFWSSWFVLELVRDEIRGFLAHESQEFLSVVQDTPGDQAALTQAAQNMAEVVDEPAFAFRVRSADGSLLAEAGAAHLLDAVRAPIGAQESWRSRLLFQGVASTRVHEPRRDLWLEVHMDAAEAMARVLGYLLWAGLGLVVSFAAAGVAGWQVARHGLSGLSDLVTKATRVPIPTSGARLDLAGAPEEVAAVGQALNGVLDRIDSGLATMRTFTAGLAHELRSPLQNLIGETEVALLSPRESHEYRDLLTSHLRELQALGDAVDNLVTHCRTATPTPPTTERESFDLGRQAELRLSREVSTARVRQVAVHATFSGDLTLQADREGCLRLVRNLVANAIQASPAGGQVEVSLRGTPEQIEIVVEDRGPGLPAELGDRVFEPFVSGPVPAGQRAGYGLGLSICRTVVEGHGGSLRHEPRPGGGTRFVATLPRRPAAPNRALATRSP